MDAGERLNTSFYTRDVLEVAPGLVGKILVFRTSTEIKRYIINDVEAYRGEEDLACHASRGRTSRTRIMYEEGGKLYVYLIYGMYWMLNVVAGGIDIPQAVLLRGVGEYNGPGKITRALGIDKSYNGEDLTVSERIWIEDSGNNPGLMTGPRIGIDYAGEFWKRQPWRYYV
jgi:DNA-3-methyladenine glycosylase